jgi:hypothetical protein
MHAQRTISEGTYPSLAVLVKDVGDQVQKYGSLSKVPSEAATPATTCTWPRKRSGS